MLFSLKFWNDFYIISRAFYIRLVCLGRVGLLLSFLVIVWYRLRIIVCNIFFLLICIGVWVKDIIVEGVTLNYIIVNPGFKIGFNIFILVEIIFFFSLFWRFFDKIYFNGCEWWPSYENFLLFFGLSFLGTVLLLVRSFFCNWVYRRLLAGKNIKKQMMLVLIFGLLFLFLQWYEWGHMFFNVRDGWYGRIYYVLIGSHRVHVFLGLLFLRFGRWLIVSGWSLKILYFFEESFIYWHFVDVIWFLLFLFFYC